MTQIKTIMTHDVCEANNTSTVFDAIRFMAGMRVSCLVICENNKPIGIVTQKDILEKVLVLNKDLRSTPLCDICSKKVLTAYDDEPVKKASAVMHRNGIKQLPIISRHGVLVGIITQTDLIHNVDKLMD